jgi:acetyl esterase
MPLHPKIEAILKATAHLPRPSSLPVEVARRGFRERTALLPPAREALDGVENLRLQVAGEKYSVGARLFRPLAAGPLPLVLYFHGGGFVLGDLDTHDGICRRLCARSGCGILSVDYRLAPEHPFPAAVEDCWLAVRWVAAQAHELGFDGVRLGLAGDSAGGTLAAATALRCRDQGGPTVCALALIYPTLEHYSANMPSYAEMASGYGLTRESMTWYWDNYLPEPQQRFDPYAVPMRAASQAGLPPTLVVTAEYDVLRDEGERYAALLVAAGVESRASRYAGMNHGFAGLAGWIEDADRALDEASRWLATHLTA